MDADLVQVEVAVNFDGLRRGWVGQVELNDRIQRLITSGYLRLLGHVTPATVEPPPVAPAAPQAVTPTATPAARPKRSRAKRDATTTPVGGDGGDNASGVRLE